MELQIWRRFICSCKCVANVLKNLRRKARVREKMGWKVGMWGATAMVQDELWHVDAINFNHIDII